jgi:NhaP-type Na+/H+ or K+/H+ antiporter
MNSWRSKFMEALVLVLAVAVVAQVASRLLEPLLPGMVILVLVAGLYALVLRRR